MRTTKVDNAWIWGVTPRRTAANMNSGRVTESGPAVKKLITKSSRERVNASMAPATIPGSNSGNVTRHNK